MFRRILRRPHSALICFLERCTNAVASPFGETGLYKVTILHYGLMVNIAWLHEEYSLITMRSLIAQSSQFWTANPWVTGSSPSRSSNFFVIKLMFRLCLTDLCDGTFSQLLSKQATTSESTNVGWTYQLWPCGVVVNMALNHTIHFIYNYFNGIVIYLSLVSIN